MARSEIRDFLEQSIDDLSDPFRLVFVARLVEGMNVEEPAELLGLRPETVKTRLHRARMLLRTTLEKQLGPALTDAFPFDGHRCGRMTELIVRRVCGPRDNRNLFSLPASNVSLMHRPAAPAAPQGRTPCSLN